MQKFMKQFLRGIVGILLIIVAIVVWSKHHAQYRRVEEAKAVMAEINNLPDYDYVSEHLRTEQWLRRSAFH